MRDTIIKIENLTKEYHLGKIGSGTLYRDLQSWYARVRGKEDPNKKVNAKNHQNSHGTFMALNGIDLEVKQGETLGIIGANGAGKSTMLKILSRVTAPTSGEIKIKGRIASMLEVGTGFHPELTGRENVYLNGAILGMTKAEITKKFNEIVAFSECEQFIDTPVKRYSSGMYVKLAFAVAAHLDPEILVVDEVLAVGDMKFQQKCLGKMGDVASQGRTVLYVSHSMNTIHQLCSRAIVLEHGRKKYDGDVDSAVQLYMENTKNSIQIFNDLSTKERSDDLTKAVSMLSVELLNTINGQYSFDDLILFELEWKANRDINNAKVRIIIQYADKTPAGMSTAKETLTCEKNKTVRTKISFDSRSLAPGIYYADLVVYEVNENGVGNRMDVVGSAFHFEIVHRNGEDNNLKWGHRAWGHIRFPELKIVG